MLKIYGSDLCPDCRECKVNFNTHGIEYEYVDMTGSMKSLKEFLTLRDALPVFAGAKASGSVGIPAIMAENGDITLDWEGYLTARGLPVVYKEPRE